MKKAKKPKMNISTVNLTLLIPLFIATLFVMTVIFSKTLLQQARSAPENYAAEASLKIPPTDDAYVNESNPGRNYGENNFLRVRNDSGESFKTYLKFDLRSIKAPVQKATLMMFAYDESRGKDAGIIVSSVENTLEDGTQWTQNNITWNNVPERIEVITTVNGITQQNSWQKYDVTNYINKSGDEVSLLIENKSTNSIFYRSREASTNKPYLLVQLGSVVTSSPVSKTATPTPRASASTLPSGSVISFTPRPTATPIRTATPTPTPTPIVYPSPSNITPPPVSEAGSMWISRSRLMSLPMSGAAWDRVNNQANSAWGAPCLYDNNCEHDVKTLAGALVAARTGNSAMLSKTVNALNSAITTSAQTARALELCRGLQSYIIAADLIGYRTSGFENSVRYLVNKPVQGHSGGSGLIGTAELSATNWGGHCRASGVAAALYLKDNDLLSRMVAAQKEMVGISKAKMVYGSTNWHADPSNKAGINRMGATRNGISISGVLPEDWRRGGEFKWPPAPTGYMWEGMQGLVVTSVLLHNANQLPITAGDNAIQRAMNVLYGKGEANTGWVNKAAVDDAWIPYLVNYYLGTNYDEVGSVGTGKGMGYTDWTHN